MNLELSPLGHTWFIDLDGTVLKHNGHKLDGHDTLLEGALSFLQGIPSGDMILFVTSRPVEEQKETESFLKEHGIPFHQVIYGLPYGERIVMNDRKPSGLETAIAVNGTRDEGIKVQITIVEEL